MGQQMGSNNNCCFGVVDKMELTNWNLEKFISCRVQHSARFFVFYGKKILKYQIVSYLCFVNSLKITQKSQHETHLSTAEK